MDRDFALQKLLREMFSGEELYRFFSAYGVDGVARGKDLLDDLPPWQYSPLRSFIADVVRGLAHRGMIGGAFFSALRRERPERRGDIEAVAELWGERAEEPPPAGSPFAPFASFVGREEESARCRQALSAGQSTLLIGGRRTGKTSLIQRISLPGRRVVRGDVAAWRMEDEESVLSGLAALVGASGSSREAIEATLTQKAPVTLILDEADRLLDHTWTGPLLSWLRYLDDTRLLSGISFLLVGGPALWRYRNPDDRGSPPLNTAQPVFLDPLAVSSRDALAAKLGREVDRAELFSEAGGHPYLLNLVLGRMWEGGSLEAALGDSYELSPPNFRTWRDQLGEDGLALLAQIPDEGVPIAHFRYRGPLQKHAEAWTLLRALCLVDIRGDRAYPSPRLFRAWLGAG